MWKASFKKKLGCSKSGHGHFNRVKLVLGLHQECLRVVKLVMEHHHMSLKG